MELIFKIAETCEVNGMCCEAMGWALCYCGSEFRESEWYLGTTT